MNALNGNPGRYQVSPVSLNDGDPTALRTDSTGALITSSDGSTFTLSPGNTTVAQLASNATFIGTVENVFPYPSLSLDMVSDQPGTLTINQYIDAAGTVKSQSWQYLYNPAETPYFSQSWTLNGNYLNLTFQNTGTSATTTLNINAAYGTIPQQGPADPSASSAVTVANKVMVIGSAASVINTNLLTGGISDWFDAINYQYVSFDLIRNTGVSAGVVSFEQTNDTVSNAAGSTVGSIQIGSNNTYAGGTSASTASTGVTPYVILLSERYFRLRISTAITGGTVQASASFSQLPYVSQIVSANLSQINSNSIISVSPGGTTNKSGVTGIAGVVTVADYTAQAWAAASGSGATIIDGNGMGTCNSFDINVTAWTAGSSTGLDVFLQSSPDNGTTWYDLWQVEAITGTGHYLIPPVYIPGRHRMRWVNRTGAATTATVTVTASEFSMPYVPIRQWFDRTANILNGTLNATTATYDVVGCGTVTATIVLGSAVAAGTYQIQVSHDGTNFASVGTATAAVASSATTFSVTGIAARYARIACTLGGNTQVGTYAAITGKV